MTEALIDIPGYRLIRKLAKGGMSTVYLAEQVSLKREVAIKVMASELSDDAVFGQRFEQEAQIASQLSHPNIVPIIDFGAVFGPDSAIPSYYIVMAYIDGQDLKKCVNKLSLVARLKIVEGVAQALSYLHQKGFVHRDIKPQNIIVQGDDQRAVLTDFGIVRPQQHDNNLTSTGTTLGTPHYMSPEQALGKKVDYRSDIYSLGVVLFYVLAGQVPFEAESSVAVGLKHYTDPIPLLDPPFDCFQPIVDRAMAKKPADRYQSAAELGEAISAISLANIEAIVQSIAATDDDETRVFSTTTHDRPTVQETEKKGLTHFFVGGLSAVAVIALAVFIWNLVGDRKTPEADKEVVQGISKRVQEEKLQPDESAIIHESAAPHESATPRENTRVAEQQPVPEVEPQQPIIEVDVDEVLRMEEPVTEREPEVEPESEFASEPVQKTAERTSGDGKRLVVVPIEEDEAQEPMTVLREQKIAQSKPPASPTKPASQIKPRPTPEINKPRAIVAGNLFCDYRLTKNWDKGWQATVTLRNPSGQTLNDWYVRMALPGVAITESFTARVDRQGEDYVLLPNSFNRRLRPGQTIELGFQGSGRAVMPPLSFIECSGT